MTKEITSVSPDYNQGLTQAQVEERLAAGLGNSQSSGAGLTEKQILAKNILTFFNLIFVVLAVILVIAGSSIKNMTFLVVVVVNIVIGCFQEIRAKRAVDKLTLIAQQKLPTIRGGKKLLVPSDQLVRDDIVEYGPGDQICADGIVRVGQLQVNESLITGEADAVVKKKGDALKSGSFVITGRARAQLTQVGDASFAAKLALEAKANPKVARSEMMASLDKLIHMVGYTLIPVGCLLFYQEFKILHMTFTGSAQSTVAALVGMIPEGLYLLTSIALAVSAMKLTRQRVLVQDMNCIESLARVDVLCVDKTGTITQPTMEVENLLPLGDREPEYLEQVLKSLYGSREPDNDTARAIQELFSGKGDWECTRYVPFTSQTKWCGGEFGEQGSFVVGAPEFILGEHFEKLREQVAPWASTGYRVLLVAAYPGELPQKLDGSLAEPLALLLLTSPLRPQARETFSYFAQQGVCIKVISGDNPQTVSAVAQRAGIENSEKYIDAGELETYEDVFRAAGEYTVFGRVTPDKKKMLIKALKEQGHTVAMTGDGVNDVLAMKESDCGIAMASGAQAASQVARLVLLDSDFSAMPDIVGEGRRVINNIQRAATLFLVKNIFSFGLAILSLLTQQPYPLAPIHMSIISGLTIGVPSFFLALEPNYQPISGTFLKTVLRRAFPGGLTSITVVLLLQAMMVHFAIPLADVRAIATAILAVVGLMVLHQVGTPMNRFRALVWWAVAAAIVGCFTLLGDFFDLQILKGSSLVALVVILLVIPTVFRFLQWVFSQGDRLWAKVKARREG